MKMVIGFLLALLAFVIASCTSKLPAELYALNNSHKTVNVQVWEDSCSWISRTDYFLDPSPYDKPTYLGMYPYDFGARISASYGPGQPKSVEFSDSVVVVRTLRGKTQINFYTDSNDTNKVYGEVVEGKE